MFNDTGFMILAFLENLSTIKEGEVLICLIYYLVDWFIENVFGHRCVLFKMKAFGTLWAMKNLGHPLALL